MTSIEIACSTWSSWLSWVCTRRAMHLAQKPRVHVRLSQQCSRLTRQWEIRTMLCDSLMMARRQVGSRGEPQVVAHIARQRKMRAETLGRPEDTISTFCSNTRPMVSTSLQACARHWGLENQSAVYTSKHSKSAGTIRRKQWAQIRVVQGKAKPACHVDEPHLKFQPLHLHIRLRHLRGRAAPASLRRGPRLGACRGLAVRSSTLDLCNVPPPTGTERAGEHRRDAN